MRDEAAQLAAVEKVKSALQNLGVVQIDTIESPILGAEGNREFLSASTLPRSFEPEFLYNLLFPMASPQASSQKTAAIISRPDRPEVAQILPGLFTWLAEHGYRGHRRRGNSEIWCGPRSGAAVPNVVEASASGGCAGRRWHAYCRPPGSPQR